MWAFFFFFNGGTACLFLRHVLTSWAYMQVCERPGELQVGRKNIHLSQKCLAADLCLTSLCQ